MRAAAGLAPVPRSSRCLLLEGSDTHFLFLLQVGKLRLRETFQRNQVLTSFGADLGQNKDEADQGVLIPGCTEKARGTERKSCCVH